MSNDNVAGLRVEIAKAVDQSSEIDLTSSRIDEIVLSATGHDRLASDLFDAAEETRFQAAHKAHQKDEGAWGGIGVLAIIVAATAAGGIFGRYGQAPGLTWMPPVLSPVVATLIAFVALASVRKPMGRTAAGTCVIALVLIVAAGVVTLLAPGLKPWEQVSIIASLAVGLVGVAWIHLVRARNPEAARERDLGLFLARREARAALAEERERAIQALDERLREAGTDVASLESLWTYAAACAAKRGTKGLERVEGPVGASKLTAILDIPRDHHDISGERVEAAWEAKVHKS
ncbi:hypothetical protein [Nocardioides sp. NPDC006273]|uniref:hypothetical protein n=1 Tax=Nocardioides sp. NPDC006273 TaxID=3155598 RepID=UPI0033B1BC42